MWNVSQPTIRVASSRLEGQTFQLNLTPSRSSFWVIKSWYEVIFERNSPQVSLRRNVSTRNCQQPLCHVAGKAKTWELVSSISALSFQSPLLLNSTGIPGRRSSRRSKRAGELRHRRECCGLYQSAVFSDWLVNIRETENTASVFALPRSTLERVFL